MSLKEFGKFVAQRREALGLNQEEVGKIAGMTKANVSAIESAKYSDVGGTRLLGLAKALRWTPEQLFTAFSGKDPESLPISPEASDISARDLLKKVYQLLEEEDPIGMAKLKKEAEKRK